MSIPIEEILCRESFDHDDITRLLSIGSDEAPLLKEHACRIMRQYVGDLVYYRGIIEFSNICTMDCYYCGIRKSNTNVSSRYSLSKDDIVSTALWCAEQGYGSIILQSGERRDEEFIDFVEDMVAEIKHRTISEKLPNGLGITLGIGEQSLEVYERLYRAGAHRYLLRIETTNQKLFSRIHPPSQTLSGRIACLRSLRDAGYQVGTGVMIGIPGQTIDMLADDIEFFHDMDIDMIGMGPYIRHPDSAMADLGMMDTVALLQLSYNMIAVTRLVLKDVNIAATTALQALIPDGRERGLGYGANVTMPNITPTKVRGEYQLYPGKPCIDENKSACRECLLRRIKSSGRDVGFNMWGDAPHAAYRGV